MRESQMKIEHLLKEISGIDATSVNTFILLRSFVVKEEAHQNLPRTRIFFSWRGRHDVLP